MPEISSGKLSYEGLEKVEELKPNFYSDILAGDPETREKVNDLIRVVNVLVELKNGEINHGKINTE